MTPSEAWAPAVGCSAVKPQTCQVQDEEHLHAQLHTCRPFSTTQAFEIEQWENVPMEQHLLLTKSV